eukprot:CAMPEP_0196725476 /NCGR_PEP_ID=MMETSP1091-20130531/7037_1 /TAXON_ID=302021 /ORGANISM="Rhodomonas sp., Strain CCMP768" /LENGTH=284 /DNA_ID=CAMNT_0042067767 /DNA_START=23 /DNA_END=877 /DNA_ORIENTATION=+
MTTEAWPQPGEKTSSGTHYIFSGPESGRLVICIHGIGAYSKCFDTLAASLASAGFRVLQYDLMGRGWSEPKDNANHDGNGHVAQLHELLTELKLENTPKDIVAHSMGGALAALYLDAHPPTQPCNLVMLAPAGLMKAGAIKPLRALSCMHGIVKPLLKGGQEGAWKQDFVVRKGDRFEAMMRAQREQAQHNPHAFNAFFQSALHFPLFGIDAPAQRIRSLPVRALLMWGKQDTAVPMKPSLQRWQAALGGEEAVETEVWEKAGHAFFLEDPGRANERIVTFLQA